MNTPTISAGTTPTKNQTQKETHEMKITKTVTVLGREWKVVSNAPASPATPPVQQYSAPPAAKPSPFARIRQLLGFKATKQSGKARCVGCGDAVQLQSNTHQFYRGDQPLCERCAGPVGAQLSQLYSVVIQNPAQQYSTPGGSVSVLK